IPTPAVRATASRLASGPPALNMTFAASRTRSRLRMASARGFRDVSADCFMLDRPSSALLKNGGILRISLLRCIDASYLRQENQGTRVLKKHQVFLSQSLSDLTVSAEPRKRQVELSSVNRLPDHRLWEPPYASLYDPEGERRDENHPFR